MRIKGIRLWMSQSCCSLGFFSQNSLWKFSTFHGYKGIYSRICEECEKSFFCKTVCSSNSLATGMSPIASLSHEIQTVLFLSCSAPTVVTLQLPAWFTRVVCWRVISLESLTRSYLNAHTLEFFTLSHT